MILKKLEQDERFQGFWQGWIIGLYFRYRELDI